MTRLSRFFGRCSVDVVRADERIAAAVRAAHAEPPCVALREAPAEIPPAHRAILDAAEAGTSIAETGVRGCGQDPWAVQELADHLCEEYGYSYRRPDLGPRD